MAIDVEKPTGQESPLRQAMNRAGSAVGKTVQRLGEAARRGEDPYMLTETADIDRRPLPRVTVKTAVVGYIEAAFINRTRVDGTILKPSRERLIEELTDLVMALDAGLYDDPMPVASNGPSSNGPSSNGPSSNGHSPMPSSKIPTHNHGELAKTE